MSKSRAQLLERERTRPDRGERFARSHEPWDPDLVEGVYDLLVAVDPASAAFEERIEALRARYGDLVYAELIFLLSHLRFEPAEARGHWKRVLEHRSKMRGAGDKPVDVRVALVSYFVEVNRKLEHPKIIEMKLFEQTREFAYRDELTGLHNYRIFRDYLEQEIQRSRRQRQPLSLVMIDLDDFKSYNDRHGHEAGNRALVAVAAELKRSLRRSDLAARYGGEEFAMILPDTRKTSARIVAERARRAIEACALALPGAQAPGRLTGSFGIATSPADADEPADLVRHADRALYVAKASGKNQVQLYGKSQRSFGRTDVALEGSFRVPAPASVALTTVNVSEGGFLCRTASEVARGTLLDFELRMPHLTGPLRGAGRVIHAEPDSCGGYRVAVCIVEMPGGDRAAFAAELRRLARSRDSAGD